MKIKTKKMSVHKLRNQIELQSMVWPGIIFLLIFSYIPMYGIIIAFKDFSIVDGIFGGEFVGFKYFKQFLTDPKLFDVLKNTLFINGLGLLINFPAPIILAVLITELRFLRFKKLTQTVSYLPHFLSWVIYGGIVIELLSSGGVINRFLNLTHLYSGDINIMAENKYFYLIFTIVTAIKGIGYGSILYISSITSVDQEMYEAAIIDGANRFQKIRYITIPAIMGTIVILFIFQISSILNTGFEQVLIFQNPLNSSVSETIDTYVYKIAMQQQRYSYATAVGLLKSVIAIILLTSANKISKKVTDKGLF
jgi:putative aldouronate transport system permease protein